MSRQAEAERETRARVIVAEGEPQASAKLSQAAAAMAAAPSALQLRLLQTLVDVAPAWSLGYHSAAAAHSDVGSRAARTIANLSGAGPPSHAARTRAGSSSPAQTSGTGAGDPCGPSQRTW
jgi:hypothetical protein